LVSKKARTSSGRAAEPSIDQELIDDQKFQVKIENKRFIDGIVRKATRKEVLRNQNFPNPQ